MSRILEKIATCILEGDADQTAKLVKKALDEGLPPNEVMDNGLLVGMTEVGVRFRAGDMFVPEVLMSAEAMQAGTTLLRPLLVGANARKVGKVLLGTVKGDLHDIGKNLVAMMCEGSGFEVIDIGFNADPEKFVDAVKQHQPEVLGMSAMLTTTMRAMGYTIKALEEAGLRDRVKIMVGGAPVDGDFAKRIGADGYGSNAPAGAELAKKFASAA
jgi:5-methyltetrahydrofolate--homocysteine methyltransferase